MKLQYYWLNLPVCNNIHKNTSCLQIYFAKWSNITLKINTLVNSGAYWAYLQRNFGFWISFLLQVIVYS